MDTVAITIQGMHKSYELMVPQDFPETECCRCICKKGLLRCISRKNITITTRWKGQWTDAPSIAGYDCDGFRGQDERQGIERRQGREET